MRSDYTDDDLRTFSEGRTRYLTPMERELAAELLELRTDPRDEHHTMAELYAQRCYYHALYCNLLEGMWVAAGMPARTTGLAVKSWRHHDSQPCFGITEEGKRWFIVTVILPDGSQVTQHYPETDWYLFNIPTVYKAPEWDGHDAAEGNRRLRAFLDLDFPGGN